MAKRLHMKICDGEDIVIDSIEVTTDYDIQVVVEGVGEDLTIAGGLGGMLMDGGTITLSYKEAVSQEK